jgi:hypothetical protein
MALCDLPVCSHIFGTTVIVKKKPPTIRTSSARNTGGFSRADLKFIPVPHAFTAPIGHLAGKTTITESMPSSTIPAVW